MVPSLAYKVFSHASLGFDISVAHRLRIVSLSVFNTAIRVSRSLMTNGYELQYMDDPPRLQLPPRLFCAPRLSHPSQECPSAQRLTR